MPTASSVVRIDGSPLSPHEVGQVAYRRAGVELAGEAVANMEASHARLHRTIRSGQPHYGINTGFGALGRIRIDEASLEQLQSNLIRSHATGVGRPLSEPTVRATMLLLAASLARGYSGVRPLVVERIVQMLETNVTPLVPETGSVGASGDLAPLAHIGLCILGEGHVLVDGTPQPAGPVLQRAGIEPLLLHAKEGLALINGTHMMAARGALIVEAFRRLFDAALIASAMSVDACRATDATLDARIHRVRIQPGQQHIADRLRQCLTGSTIIQSHREDDPRVQDPYSFRCSPAVLGAVLSTFQMVEQATCNELAAVTDNPLIFPSNDDAELADIVSGGNFHGMPIAMPMDMLAIGLCHLAGLSERRTFHMLSGQEPEAELPTFLTPQAGLQSGLMIAQYTAAACCNELIGLANPASVANIGTSANMEDYNSFGPRAAAKAERGIELATSVVAIELLCAGTGIEYHRPLRSGHIVERALETIRSEVPPLLEDRPPAPDIEKIARMIGAGCFRLASD